MRRSRRTRAAIEWELDVMEALGGKGIRVPAVVRTKDGARFHNDAVILDYVDGRRPNDRDDWLAVAEYLHTVHAALPAFGQRPGFKSAGDLLIQDGGGDIDLTAMPREVVHRCRLAWARLADHPPAMIHGDPGASNILMTDPGVVLIDWDECRVDVPLFDLAALPRGAAGLEDHSWWIASPAASAWEVAVSWHIEPDYARRRLAELEE